MINELVRVISAYGTPKVERSEAESRNLLNRGKAIPIPINDNRDEAATR